MSSPVFRFAPSPNGRLHLGHAYSALLDHALARRLAGRFLLRLEDIDTTRCRPEFEAGILEDLAWLGLDWDGEIRRQSDHFADYRAVLDRLAADGLLRESHATRAEIRAAVARAEAEGRPWPRDPDGAPWPPPEDRLAPQDRPGEPVALRLDTAAALARLAARFGPADLTWREAGAGPDGETGLVAADPAAWGDPVLARKETPTSYHLSVVVDDAAQGVTHVVRGRDLFWSTSVHRLLQTLLGLPAPVFHHHDLIRDADGRKLSKSAADTALASLRGDGLTPADVRRLVDWPATERRLDRLSEALIRLG
ncbi:tRNA glutamyl-Q(34) synthetase GluQRS [Pinisolibacter aquiterrae]|uniref:tRNA glutamyl-Q(34) synthetase GluQRS n=1 Tax=Pinisolibacter aquiterrae TaxID=2815579 RepID=UPI001C3E3345|nr:tRNA glutamyl-Q(34) synthetase GluQRS [Pinisolibacter aquiterrae]MBV5262972.1 tRNA glutamyl-Q(34) synthetase GluQRS [Pinisolibacter aquiterrae]MCC8235314.1 tRNA glutamyl-Q(34) synthetase GluQRS [Pinisolibacter aquiterrae]